MRLEDLLAIPRDEDVLVVMPLEGLCNRMLTVTAGLTAARALSRRLIVVWDRTPQLNCPFGKLFGKLPDADVVECALAYAEEDRRSWNAFVDGFGFDLILDAVHCGVLLHKKTALIPIIAQHPRAFVAYMQRFVPSAVSLREMTPTDAVRARVDAIAAEFSAKTVGVHIRRSDHKDAVAVSTDAAFFAAADAALAEGTAERFFLATDDTTVEATFRARYGTRILTQEHKKLARYSPKAIEDALVDVLALSRTARIIGSFGSSFSQVAAEIGAIPIAYAGSAEPKQWAGIA